MIYNCNTPSIVSISINQMTDNSNHVTSGRSLLSTLALQLSLRVAKIPSSVLCFHCQKSYATHKRAPKIGQRNFCPDCRNKRIPQKYALADFRQKRRSTKHLALP